MPKSITSRDVAQAAGVSQSTVSYVLSGKRFVAPETESKVLAAMNELGYRPHVSARALRSKRSTIIGLVVPYHALTDIANQYRYIVSIGAACRRYGYELLVTSSEEGIDGMRRLVDSGQCDGLVIMDILHDDPRVAAAHDARIPSVFIGLPHQDKGADAVDTDFEEIGRRCVSELTQRGHRHIALFTARNEHIHAMGFSHRFHQALQEAATEAGAQIYGVDVERGYTPIAEAIAQVFQDHTDISGIIVGPSLCADDAANALLQRDIEPGQDLALIAASAPAENELHTPVDYARFDPDVTEVVSAAISRLVWRLEELSSPSSRSSSPSTGSSSEAEGAPRTILIPPVFYEGTSLTSL